MVDCFFQHQNLQEVRDKQTEILDAYRRDISKHTTATESIRIGQVLQSLPSQLAKENKKFIYNVLKKGARATEYELAIQWLMDAGLVHKVCLLYTSWVMKHFGLTEFENVAYINCDVEPLAKELFAADYNIPRILLTLQAITGTKIEAGKTLIVFDELQEVERGLHSLKYFQENAPEYHVMAAGSLLGITLGKGQSFPVGKVNVMHLYPMDFEEFLMAAGETDLCDLLHQPDWEILKILSLKYVDLLRQYYYVGGMRCV